MPSVLRYFDTGKQLEELAELLSSARLACIDCEWSPSGPPKASLLQLALLTSAGPDSQCNPDSEASSESNRPEQRVNARYERHVVLVDVQELVAGGHQKVLRTVLLDAFKSNTLLKLAHSLTNDASALLRALDLPLEHHGRMELAVDIRQLLARLKTGAGFKHIGLSAMLETLTGLKLSKELQCSDWASRPLADVQLAYAAADAACLVDLFVCAARLYAGEMEPRVEQNSSGYYDVESAPQVIDLGVVDADVFHLFGQRWEYQRGKWRVVHDDDSAFWRSSHPSRKKKGRGRRSTVASTPRPHHLPSEIPWHDPREARFVCDDMCSGLARELRLFGIDCECVPTQPQRYLTHRILVELAEAEDRVILTRDVSFASRKLSQRLYFVQSDGSKRHQTEEVIRAFDCVESSKTSLMTRCAMCNGSLRSLQETSKLPEWVPEGVKTTMEVFWVCSKDESHVYWRGGQYQRSLERLQEQLQDAHLV